MSALVTQTLEENLKNLLIAEPSKLSWLLVDEIKKQHSVDTELISLSGLTEHSLAAEKWYKIILLIENTTEVKALDLELINSSSYQITVVMPLTTAIMNDNANKEWINQVNRERDLFSFLNKNIDESMFIFYSDLTSTNIYPIKMFFSQLKKNILRDPGLNLNLQTVVGAATAVTDQLLKPHYSATLVSGKSRKSSVCLQSIRDFYFSYYQTKLMVRSLKSEAMTHPILDKLKNKIFIVKKEETISAISREVISLIPETKSSPQNKESLQINNLEQELDYQQLDLEEKSLEQAKEEVKESVSKPAEKIINSVLNDFKEQRQHQRQHHLRKLTKSTKIGIKKIKNQKFLFGGGILVSGIALTVLVLTVVFLSNLSQAETSFVDYLKSRSMPATAQQKKLQSLSEIVDNLSSKTSIINQWFSTPYFSKSFQILEISGYVVDLEDQINDLKNETGAFFQQVVSQNNHGSLDEVNKASADVYKTISLLSAELKSYPQEKLSTQEVELMSEYESFINDQERKINSAQRLAPILPSLLAENGEKTYALLLQNNQELRPTGGFIQAVALLTFKNGILINIQVEDVYTLDQQLKAIVTPPIEVTQFLGEERWYLRDSNWSPNFPDAASQVRWFLNKSIGINVDGVIALNLKTLEEIIGVLDRVEIDEYNEVLTKRNLAERIEFHSEVQLIETSQSRDYSELVLLEVLNKIKSLKVEKATLLLSSLIEMADAKELLIEVFDKDSRASFEALGWDGSLVSPACPTVFEVKDCQIDTIMQVEANVGVNKANYYLERQIDHSISISSEKINHKRVINFKNKAQTNAWPKGPYKSYLRFYLPETANFEQIKINDQVVDEKQLIFQNQLGRKMVGVLIEVAVKSELKLQLEYSLPYQQQSPFTYAFFDQKQPGARDASPRIFLQHNPDLSPTLIAPQAEVQGDLIVFNPSRDIGHLFVGASFE